ncbi:tyrosine-type recombinase/integrase [Bifidobacterium simiarum]|uniref:tyrosine-type recombinase/integrase n=1 Tax=Bifidobacterium simiarum TaxID=2045441 RepID=UPI001BDC4599|nr:site-specific integrase [Bifidobacterium simiarum]MBT1167005.1 site-specific integrase [Bifidobacterium simiarum]
MAKAWIKDTWLRQDAPANVKRLVNSAADNPGRVVGRIPAEWRLAKFGRGRRWVLCWYELVDGRRVERNRSFATKTEAERARTAISDDQYSGRYVNVEDRGRTFGEAASEWRASQHSVRQSTGRNYDDVLRMYVNPRWRGVRLMDIDETAVNEWVQALKDCRAPYSFVNGKKPSTPAPKYLNTIVNVVFGGVIRYAVRRGWLVRDPMADVHVPRDDGDPEREARRKVFLTYDQVELLADKAGLFDARDAAMIRFMAYVGTRPGETYAMRVGDVDFDGLRVNVVRSLTKDSGGNWMIGGTKTGRPRKVALPAFLADELKRLVKGRDAGEYLFPARGGGFLRPENWRGRVFDRAVRLAGLDGVEGLRPHSLRHTFASLAIAAGCDVRTLAAALGHADVTMTLNEYAGLWPDRLDEVADAMARNRAEKVHQG